MPGIIEEAFDAYPFDFLDDVEFADGELADCTFNQDELEQFLAPPQERWHDYFSTNNPAVITMDSAKTSQWDLARAEVKHVKKMMRMLLGNSSSESNDITPDQIVMFCIGPKSKVGIFLCNELGLDEQTYLKFMSTACIQAAYRVSVTQLFHQDWRQQST